MIYLLWKIDSYWFFFVQNVVADSPPPGQLGVPGVGVQHPPVPLPSGPAGIPGYPNPGQTGPKPPKN